MKKTITRATLPALARALSQSISVSLLDRAELASDARNAGILDYAAIIGVAFRRAESTVSHWARCWDWIRKASYCREWVGTKQLPYSFFESAARYSDRIETPVLCELLLTYHENAGATLESFRAELAVMAGAGGDVAEIRKGLSKTRTKILGWVDRMPSKKGGEYLKAAADALADAMAEFEGEPSESERAQAVKWKLKTATGLADTIRAMKASG